MKKHFRSSLEQAARIVVIVSMLIGLAMSATSAGAASTPIDGGYVDIVYGAGIEDEPTGAMAESKLWYNDGFWWGALFNGTSNLHEIYRFDAATKSWVETGVELDTRLDSSETLNTAVDNRLEVLWHNSKLYVVSHIEVTNSGWTNNATQFGKLFRYSYNATTDTYSPDTADGYPVDISEDRTEALVIDVDSDDRLWATYVSRPQSSAEYHVFVNWSGAGQANHNAWRVAGGTPTPNALDLTSVAAIGSAANVDRDDISSVITYGNKTGVMWSNSRVTLDPDPLVEGDETRVNKFYYAEHDNTQAGTTGWTLTDITAVHTALTSNDHIKLVSDENGWVYAAVKTNNVDTGMDQVAVLARNPATGLWTYDQASTTGSKDTHPIIVLNEDTNVLHLFVVGNEGGGWICTSSSPTPALNFPNQNCNEDVPPANRFIYDIDTYTRFDNPTSTKQNVTNAMGLLVVASEDQHGRVYGHNLIPSTTAPLGLEISTVTPGDGETVSGGSIVVTVTFNQPVNEATVLSAANFFVTGPGGAVPGNRTYDAATNTATFTSTGALAEGSYTATVTTGVTAAAGGDALDANRVWSFTYEAFQANFILYLPSLFR